MTILVALAGVFLGLIIFVNLMPAGKGIKKENSKNPENLDPAKVLRASGKVRPRICPVCGSLLDKQDFLYAALSPDPGPGRKRQAQIYGCRHCFSTDGVNLENQKIGKLGSEEL